MKKMNKVNRFIFVVLLIYLSIVLSCNHGQNLVFVSPIDFGNIQYIQYGVEIKTYLYKENEKLDRSSYQDILYIFNINKTGDVELHWNILTMSETDNKGNVHNNEDLPINILFAKYNNGVFTLVEGQGENAKEAISLQYPMIPKDLKNGEKCYKSSKYLSKSGMEIDLSIEYLASGTIVVDGLKCKNYIIKSIYHAQDPKNNNSYYKLRATNNCFYSDTIKCVIKSEIELKIETKFFNEYFDRNELFNQSQQISIAMKSFRMKKANDSGSK